MSAHVRGRVYESKGVFSVSDPSVTFFKYECSCGWLGFDVNDQGIAREDWKRHAAQQTAEIAA